MTFFKIDEMSQKLLLGFENSFVVMISRKREIESSRNNKSMALCDIEEFLNLKDLVTQLDLERNMIRKNSENIIEEYREVKEEEILNIKDTLENNIKIQQEKIKALEKRYDDMEEEKDEFINNLKKENKSDMDKKIDFYENIISEHLRESMRNKNNYFEDIENIKSQNNKKILSLDNTILQIRNEYEEKLRMEKIKQDSLERKLREQNIEILDLCIRVDHKDKEMDKIIQVEKTARLKERENYENEIKDLKANVVILNDEKDVLNDSAAMGRMQIQMLKEELVEKEEKIDEYQKNLSISEKEQELCNATLLEKHKNISLLKSKLFILEHQLKDEKIEKHKSEKHMIEFEIKIEDMARNVYDERKLQHNALSLIAFYKNYAPIPIKSKLNLMKN
uniref:Uncharacterized protein n=1 Tax=Rhabditophanes sp. KR3021 TaxID=114890 RepID=A0AC35UCF0_9BILA